MAEKKATSSINKEMAASYRCLIEKIRDGAQEYSLVDYPAYNNTGDSAIWLGQKEALAEIFKKNPSYVASQHDYKKDIHTFCKKGIIFINGGGNFGDLWPNHQIFRLRLLRDYPERKIVQLPQSIHFSKSGHLEETKAIIGKHRDFHLYVRDQASFDFAAKEFDCPVYLAPDAAHCIRAYALGSLKYEVFSLIRTDKESSRPGLRDILSSYGPTEDWEGLDESFFKNEGMVDKFFRRHVQYKFSSSKIMMIYRSSMYDRLAQKSVDKGTNLLSQGKLIVSDRLHAHIICLLMGKRHISLDNSNGKIGEYIRQWGDFGITHLVDSNTSLLEKIEELRDFDN